MTRASYIVGDSLTVLRTLPDASVDLIMSSPPFLALRSYLPADHPDKAKEIGSEATPGEFLDVLLDVVVECRRVLAPHGSLVFELGDTYSGSGGAGGDYAEGGLRDGQPAFDGSSRRSGMGRIQGEGHERSIPARRVGTTAYTVDTKGPGWPPLAKCLTLIPQSFAWALAYGRNPFTGREIEPWRVRNVVAWCRPNPPVGALGDKFRPATSYLTVACMSGKRYFDLDAVRTEPVTGDRVMRQNPRERAPEDQRGSMYASSGGLGFNNPAGAPPLDYWVIPTQPYKGSHYATYPTALVEKPVKAMCPQRVCRVCGEPSRRIVENPNAGTGRNAWNGSVGEAGFGDRPNVHESITLGWSDCGCCPHDCCPVDDGWTEKRPCSCSDKWRSGVVLDPFAGSGTTLEVATGHGRDAIGIDLDERNAEQARQRIGPMLFERVECVA